MADGVALAGRFRLDQIAGAGGMGVVHRAVDLATGKDVALKMLHSNRLAHAGRFTTEAQVLADLAHPGIVGYVAHGIADGGQAYLAMEWLAGESVEQRLQRGWLPIAEGVAIAIDIADALAF